MVVLYVFKHMNGLLRKAALVVATPILAPVAVTLAVADSIANYSAFLPDEDKREDKSSK